MNRSWLCVCFATLRLLQCFTCTIFALLVSFNLSCFATILIILSILSISVSDHNRPWMLLIVSCVQLCPQKSVGNCRYEYPLWLSRSLVTWNTWLHERPTSIRMDTRLIVQSPNLSRSQLSNYLTKLAFIVQQSNADTRYIARSNVFASHIVRFRARKFHSKNTFFTSDYFGNSLRKKSKFFDGTDIFSLLLVHRLWKGL